MKHLFWALILTSFGAFSQDYWQQEVNYTIKVSLNDKKHMLSAFEEFTYINNSPDVLDTIWMHIWPNAYKNGETALAKQQYSQKEDMLKFGDDSVKGYIDSLDFKVNGASVTWDYHPEYIDVCYLVLAEPLQPGASLKVSTPFRVKIPSGEISRLGHIGESYQITQWYPKPAVYDVRGWNAMPYLNQGEFYSEYGSFDVEITLPSNYVVGATGDLQTKSEVDFLTERAQKTQQAIDKGENFTRFDDEWNDGFPASSSTMKTIRYTQKNVHDFAWFADKRFNVLKSEVKLPHSGEMVTSWAMYTKRHAGLWTKASEYLNDAIYYYSLWNGDYPYKNVTAVDGTISAGGGMEYPNVTVIGGANSDHSLEVVIVHEVGHNWFYGQLGTNERVHGWMDEGMNTLNEIRYVQTKYPKNTALSDMVMNGSFHMDHLNHHDMADISYRMIAALGEDQPIETHSADYTSVNYGVIMYQKTGLVFYYLKDYLGDELFDKCMHTYYDRWEFKHPQPKDMQDVFEEVSGKKLDWVFVDLIQTTNHLDFKLKRVKSEEGKCVVTVKNKGQIEGPVEVAAYAGDKLVETQWIEAGFKKETIEFNHTGIDQVRIDPNVDIPEMNRQNNLWNKNNAINRLEPITWEFLAGDNEPEKTNVFWTPMMAGNKYDGFMLGVTAHNYGVPFNKFGYLISPFYSFRRKFVSGIAELNYNFYPKKGLKLSRFGVSVKSFKSDTIHRANESYFLTVAPYWTAKIGNRGNATPFAQTFRVQTLYRKDVAGSALTEQYGAYAQYALTFTKPDHFLEIKARNEFLTNSTGSNYYSRATLESTYKYRYIRNKMKRWVEVRAFVGQQYMSHIAIQGDTRYQMPLSGANGAQDLFVDDYFFGRNETSGLWSQQQSNNMGGFKYSPNIFATQGFMATSNVYFQLPVKTGLLWAFADFGAYQVDLSNGSFGMSDFLMNTGLAIRAGDIFAVYFPLWMNTPLYQPQQSMYDSYAQKIRFTLRLNLINKPINLSSFL